MDGNEKSPRKATGACHKGVLIARADYITGSRLAPFVKISWSPFSTLLPRQDMGCLSLAFNIISVSFSILALAGSMLNYCQLDLGNTFTLVKFQSKPLRLVFNGMNVKMQSAKYQPYLLRPQCINISIGYVKNRPRRSKGPTGSTTVLLEWSIKRVHYIDINSRGIIKRCHWEYKWRNSIIRTRSCQYKWRQRMSNKMITLVFL